MFYDSRRALFFRAEHMNVFVRKCICNCFDYLLIVLLASTFCNVTDTQCVTSVFVETMTEFFRFVQYQITY